MQRFLGQLGMALACFACLTWSSVATAQVERYELGKRTKRFELAWQEADAAKRAACVKPISTAVQSFFSLQLTKAGQSIDEAFLATTKLDLSPDFQRWVISKYASLKPTLCNEDTKELSVQLDSFYDSDFETPADTKIRLIIKDWQLSEVTQFEFEASQLSQSTPCDLEKLAEGDYWVCPIVECGKESFSLLEKAFSKIHNLEKRLEAVDNAASEKTAFGNPTLRATIRNWSSIIKSVKDENQLETDYPLHQWLVHAEQLVADPTSFVRLSRELAERDYWLTLHHEGRNLPVRVRAPKDTNQPMPILVAYHGAGGSENMFFETYGAGRAVTLAVERGWLIVAPRQGLMGMGVNLDQTVDEVEKLFPVDRSKIFVMGHSMGAAQVMNQVSLAPKTPRAAVALGGGRSLPSAKKLDNFPWFVAAGQFDFGRNGAKGLADSLLAAKKPVIYREYPDVEHLVIVQAALDDVFAFFDQSSSPEQQEAADDQKR